MNFEHDHMASYSYICQVAIVMAICVASDEESNQSKTNLNENWAGTFDNEGLLVVDSLTYLIVR